MSQRWSRHDDRNPNLHNLSDEFLPLNNTQFFLRAFDLLAPKGVSDDGMLLIGLVGSRDIPGHRLRLAQSILRWDLRPSYWSHAFLVAQTRNGAPEFGELRLLEISLNSASGEFPRPEWNGVSEVPIRVYNDEKLHPNVALIGLKLKGGEAADLLDAARRDNANRDKLRYDLWAALGAWQCYLWSNGAMPNPLTQSVPIPASAYLEMVFEAIRVDLTPGTSERNSAPEHIWTTVKFWHDAFKKQGRDLHGAYVVRDPHGGLLTEHEMPIPLYDATPRRKDSPIGHVVTDAPSTAGRIKAPRVARARKRGKPKA